MIKPTHRLLVLLSLCSGALAGCGTEKTDVSQGVEKLNAQVLSQQGAELDCPDEVEGGEGATFDCTMKGTGGDRTADVQMKIVEEEGELAVDIANGPQFERALETVTTSG